MLTATPNSNVTQTSRLSATYIFSLTHSFHLGPRQSPLPFLRPAASMCMPISHLLLPYFRLRSDPLAFPPLLPLPLFLMQRDVFFRSNSRLSPSPTSITTRLVLWFSSELDSKKFSLPLSYRSTPPSTTPCFRTPVQILLLTPCLPLQHCKYLASTFTPSFEHVNMILLLTSLSSCASRSCFGSNGIVDRSGCLLRP